METGNFVPIFFDNLMSRLVRKLRDRVWDVELYRVSPPYFLSMQTEYHFNIFFDAGVADPSFILAITKILPLSKITWKPSLLLQRLLEKRVANAALSEYTLIVEAGVRYRPEAYFSHGVVELIGELLLATRLIKA